MAIEAELQCKTVFVKQPYPNDGRLYCNATWDGWGCWNYTLAGTTAQISCPSYRTGFDPSMRAYRTCNEDGTWWRPPGRNVTWSDYNRCVDPFSIEREKRRIWMFIAGYGVSIAASTVALAIFCAFRQLHCDRVTIHKNLLFSYILQGITWILYLTLASHDAEVLENNPIWCQFVYVATQYFVICNYFWMFAEGLYLHTIMAVAFISGKKLLITCILIGWGLPVVPCTTFIVVRIMTGTATNCWMHVNNALMWIISGPICVTILLNIIFLAHILYILLRKLRANNSPDTVQSKKVFRAMLILIPLLGLQYVIYPYEPDEDSLARDVYRMVVAFFTSFQGLFIALLFCFLNEEVISVIKRKWRQRYLMDDHVAGTSRVLSHCTEMNDVIVSRANSTRSPSVRASTMTTSAGGVASEPLLSNGEKRREVPKNDESTADSPMLSEDLKSSHTHLNGSATPSA